MPELKDIRLGGLVRDLRESAKMTQTELAGRCGLAPSTISLIESGKRVAPGRDTIERLALGLGVSPDELVSDVGSNVVVQGDVTIGRGTRIAHNVVILAKEGKVTIGENCHIDVGAFIESSSEGCIVIGDRCTIGPYAVLRAGLTSLTLSDGQTVPTHAVL